MGIVSVDDSPLASWKTPTWSACWRNWQATTRSTCPRTRTNGRSTYPMRSILPELRKLAFLSKASAFALVLASCYARSLTPAYYYYGLGDEVQLSAEIIPVRVR